MEELADKLGFAQTFLRFFSTAFYFFSSPVSLFYASATALNKSAMLQITVCCDFNYTMLTCEGTSLLTF